MTRWVGRSIILVSVDQIEKYQRGFPAILRYGFLMLTVLAVITMPVGGGWLMVPGSVGLLLSPARD